MGFQKKKQRVCLNTKNCKQKKKYAFSKGVFY